MDVDDFEDRTTRTEDLLMGIKAELSEANRKLHRIELLLGLLLAVVLLIYFN